ncbi:MAG TPA: GNAT family N-acetyltransferase [Prolixibacteraceae bacterium]|nr:GNAT family N-acetyltransferase [Prolixibacteraceae bacterium]
MITKCTIETDFDIILEIINDAAIAYKGIIPPDRWKEPYMPAEELRTQIAEGVEFWKYIDDNEILGVMGIQDKSDVTLIRHAYVRTKSRQQGIGGKLLQHLIVMAKTPILIGTWADAFWAVDFYKKHGFRQVTVDEKKRLLRIYWSIPERQVETSVVLASENWKL